MSADDQRLITDSLRGDTTAFGELVRRYQDRLYNTVFRILNHNEDAQDVVQEAFLSAYQSLGNFKGDAQFFTWLYRIAVNTAISHKRKHRMGLSIHPGSQGGTAMEPVDSSLASQPGQALQRQEEENRVQQALLRLSPEHRAVLVLKDMEGQKYEDMAAILGVPIGTIRSRLHRARTELREVFEKDEERERNRNEGKKDKG